MKVNIIKSWIINNIKWCIKFAINHFFGQKLDGKTTTTERWQFLNVLLTLRRLWPSVAVTTTWVSFEPINPTAIFPVTANSTSTATRKWRFKYKFCYNYKDAFILGLRSFFLLPLVCETPTDLIKQGGVVFF